MDETRIVILGGTSEAAELVRRLTAALPGIVVITSLAGRTTRPASLPGRVRIGGFGGADGLARYLEEHAIAALVDATHPFAARMPFHAQTAARPTGIPLLRLERPAWQAVPGDRWLSFDDLAQAAAAVPTGARVFLTTGRQELAPFVRRADVFFLIRSIDPPDVEDFASCAVELARGPFTVEAEEALMLRHEIDVLVTKNSGAVATAAKLDAARRLGLPVLMIERPPRPDAPTVPCVDDAVAWLQRIVPTRIGAS